jgi:hypothetical protein
MKLSRIFQSALIAVMAITMCAAPASADSFALHNKTSHEMTALYVSPSDKDSWGDNVLGGTIPAGDDGTFTWSKNADDVCNWDVRGEFADGSSAEVKDVDFCTVTEVTFTN